jgi:hypothetical protein
MHCIRFHSVLEVKRRKMLFNLQKNWLKFSQFLYFKFDKSFFRLLFGGTFTDNCAENTKLT